MKDYYKVLGIPHNAGGDEISKAYKVLSQQYNPENNKGDMYAEERFIDVSIAYKTLIDTEKRKDYDKILAGIQTGVVESDVAPVLKDKDVISAKKLPVVSIVAVFFVLFVASILIFWLKNSNNRQDDKVNSSVAVKDTSNNPVSNTLNSDTLVAAAKGDSLSKPVLAKMDEVVKQPVVAKDTTAGEPAKTNKSTISVKVKKQDTPQKTTGIYKGGTKQHVLDVQGTPEKIVNYGDKGEAWHYGKSTVFFKDGKIASIKNTGENLKLKTIDSMRK